MQVLKFGGSSVANAENILKVIEIIRGKVPGNKLIVVVSALGGVTDELLQIATMAEANDESYLQLIDSLKEKHLHAAKSLIPENGSETINFIDQSIKEITEISNGVFLLQELSMRTKDRMMSYGEILSSTIINASLNKAGIKSVWKDARELIKTDNNYGNANVDFAATNENIQSFLQNSDSNLYLIPGFIATDTYGITTTLGRGGSDYTAAILAAGADAEVLEIWTDVSGMMTADPRLVNNFKNIPQISYQEAMELSHFGAKVIYPPTIQPVMQKGIPVKIKNTFKPHDAGTLIMHEATATGLSIQGISSISKIALLSLEGSGMVGIPGFSKRLFEALANACINVILITQGSSEHSICVGVDEHNSTMSKRVLDKTFVHEIQTKKVEPLIVETALSIVAIVGDNMKNHSGISGKMFSALGKNGISIRAIAQGSSERNISAVIKTHDVKKAINVLHEEFFETTYKQVNLFIAGAGNVGKKLLAQLQKQQSMLTEHLKIQVKLIGIANSKKMFFKEDGIDLVNWEADLSKGETMNLDDFSEKIIEHNLRNSVFADITANDDIAATYGKFLEKSISVVACNKVAASSDFAYYEKLKNLAREFNSSFLFETNVGAGLPVIGTLNDLLHSGDKINKIEAVLSGTLNFVFNHYDGSRPFAEVVRQAQEEGYTEPDPRLDLSGKDVMRKILILARESGVALEMNDISNESFLPDSCYHGSVDDFYVAMQNEEEHFVSILEAAKTAGKKLKFVASYENGKAAVGLQQVDDKSDFYHLYGKDNAVLFYTERYPDQPLVIKGAGAGAEVTASGVFADIIRTAAN